MYILGIDIGGTAIKHAVLDAEGKVYVQGEQPVPHDSLQSMGKVLHDISAKYSRDYALSGAAISAPGSVESDTGLIKSINALPYLEGVNVKEEFSRILQLPTAIENDANCAALGETWLGAAQGCRDVIFVVCGTGVGGAIIKDGRVHGGAHCFGGEIGFMPLDGEGHFLDDMGSVGGLVRHVEQARQLAPGTLDGRKVFELQAAGDEVADREIKSMYRSLAQAIFGLQYAFDPEVFVIGGGISSRPGFVEGIRKQAELFFAKLPFTGIKPEIRACQYGNTANLLGAVWNFLRQNPEAR